MKRRKTGKSLALTPRDLAIFELLERYRYLRSTFIHAFVGGASATRFKERLGDLYHEGGYLNRPEQQWQVANSRYMPVVYENGKRAREVLAMHGRFADPCPHMPYGTSGAGRQFTHSLMICETLASIELVAKARADLRFVAWPEILAKAPETVRRSGYPLRLPLSASSRSDKECGGNRRFVVPDGLFGIEYRREEGKAYRFFALELDCGTMPVRRSGRSGSSFAGKLEAYWHLIEAGTYRSSLGIPNLLVLSVTTSEYRMRTMMSALPGDAGASGAFLFGLVQGSVLPDGRREGRNTALWESRDRAALDILSCND